MSNNDWSPNHGDKKEFKKKLHLGFDKDTNTIIFRILPQPKGFPYNSLEYNNTPFNKTWHRFHSGIFGFKNMDGQHRPFESSLVRNNKLKTIESPCRATELINDLKAKLEEARATGNAAVQPKLNLLVGQKGVYSVNNNEHMNVVLLDGSIGELKLRYKAFLVLKAEIDKLRTGDANELGFDPLSFTNGRYFVMNRSNTGRDTTFSAAVYKEKVDVPGYGKLDRPVVHAITPELLARLETEGFNLNDIYLKVTSEECAQIVNEADLMSGKSPAINRIFDDRWKAKREAKAAAQTAAQPVPAAVVAPTVVTPTVVTPTAVAPLVAPVANVAPPVTPVIQPVSVPAKTQAQAIEEQSDNDFFKELGIEI